MDKEKDTSEHRTPVTEKQQEGILTSGHNISYWVDSVLPLKFSPLTQNIETEVVIVGGGIAGLTTAYCLTQQGKRVILIEDGFLGSGESGRTTAHIVNALDDRYTEIERLHGEKGVRLAAESHTAAIEFVAETVRRENIDCDFKRVNGYLFLHPTDKIKTLEDELEATNKSGILTELIVGVPGIPSESGPCLQFPHQAQFHIMKYLSGLAKAITSTGGQIFTETHAEEFKKDGVIANGFMVKAEHVVIATNTPINDLVTMHTKQFPYRSYVIGALIPKGSIEPALWWDTGDHESKWDSYPYNYVRTQPYDAASDLLICGGQDHKTGQADTEDIPEEDRYKALEEWARLHFPMMEQIIYRWSGQVMEPLDEMGFIGRNPGDKKVYIATGDSGNGMTHGTIAGMLISDLIIGKENRWEELYSPSRISIKVAGRFLKETGSMAAQYVDFLKKGDVTSADELSMGEGAIMSMGLKKFALYRDEQGTLHSYSAVCPHLGCILQWNGEEKSFDCPCHGSRFTFEGKVINGPAISDLKEVELKES